MLQQAPQAPADTDQQKFEAVLARPDFAGLKAILEQLTPDPASRSALARRCATYEQLIAKLGYRLELTKQIHVQDCYSRLGPAGGIRAVLPCYDIPTQSSLPTVVNHDHSVTTTPKAAVFFNAMLADLKRALLSKDK